MIHRRTGTRYRPHQFCNDWITGDGPDGKQRVLNPITIELESQRRFSTPRTLATSGNSTGWTATSFGNGVRSDDALER
jgi:hypothetical protein